MTYDLTEYPINHPASEGESKISWGNTYLRVLQVPSVFGDHVSVVSGTGAPFTGAGTLISDGNNILLVKQNRWASGYQTWEIPMGGIDPEEAPEDAAIRELFEETGLALPVSSLNTLGTVRPLSAKIRSLNHIYHVSIPKTPIEHVENDEIITIAWVPIEDVYQACLTGTISCETTIIAVLRARLLGLI